MSDLTVTFLFTDVEGSTKLWEDEPDAMARALSRHDVVVTACIERQGGLVVKSRGEGDSVFAVFPGAIAAVAAALDLQLALADEPWSLSRPIRVRIALHTGSAELRDGDYYGPDVNRCARLRAIGHGDQILLSATTAAIVAPSLPVGASVRDLGMYRLRDLRESEHVFQLAHPAIPLEFPPLNASGNAPHNLPSQPTQLIGREREIAEISEQLRSDAVRLVSLTGPVGSGKTRLAIEIASRLLQDFPDGVFLVELAMITDDRLVSSAVADAIGLREREGRTILEILHEYLRHRAVLILLDNFEHVLPAAPLVARLLTTCPKLTVLVTSRAALRVRGENEIHVLPLELPDVQNLPPASALMNFSAVNLFVERSREVKPNFVLTEENSRAVAEVCLRLDGLPLAIELAAARSRLLSPQAILARLDHRLALLSSGMRDLPARQRTLRATLDWSHSLLTNEEQRLFRRLGIFVGGCTTEAIESVSAGDGAMDIDILECLTSIVEHSLVRHYESRDGDSRFFMLETIRDYALDQLDANGEASTFHERRRIYFQGLAAEAAPMLQGIDQEIWLARLDAENANLRRALEHCSVDDSLRFCAALWRFWEVRGQFAEGRAWMERALEEGVGSSKALRVPVCSGAGTLAWYQGDYERAEQLHSECMALARELDDSSSVAFSLNNLGAIALNRGNDSEAEPLFNECLELARSLGDRRTMIYTLHNLGEVARHRAEYDRAVSFYRQSLEQCRMLDEHWAAAINLAWMGLAEHCQGHDDIATKCFSESLMLCQTLGDTPHTVECLEGLAKTAFARGELQRAATLFGAAEGLRETIGAPIAPAERGAYDAEVQALRQAYDQAKLTVAWMAGRALSAEQAAAYALDPRIAAYPSISEMSDSSHFSDAQSESDQSA